VLEISKWALVIWLLWPLSQASEGSVSFVRVLMGILLFVIFAGKLFYDTIIEGAIRQRRTSVKQDVAGFLGMVAGIAVVVGLVVLLVGFMIVELMTMASQPSAE
jgi:hypothetical protein